MAAHVQLHPGAVFAQDYRIIGPLDEGGMGVVYRAEQLSTGESRALKLLKPAWLGDGASRERFAQEATIGSHVESDHVVKVIAAGIDDESGVPWIAMELLRGDNLAKVVRSRKRLHPFEVLQIARPLCHALEAAHRAGVVHRDLKPENVFIARTQDVDARPTVKLLDFGIAKMIQDYETSVLSTAVIGSPLWMAPEQVRMGKVKPATDVWALGLMVFWMLTGRFYWKAAQQRSAGQAEALLHEKLYDSLDPASRRAAMFGVDGALPTGFDEWFRNCVTRDPSDRFATAGVAFATLEHVLTQPPPRARPRLRGALAGALIGCVALIGGALGPPLFVARLASLHGSVRAVAPPPPPAPEPPPVRVVSVTPVPPAIVLAPAHIHVATRARPAVVPQAEGYTFRTRDGDAARCADRAHPHAWQVSPDWYERITEPYRQHALSTAHERAMATRATDHSDEFVAAAERSERSLDAERRSIQTTVEHNLAAERALQERLAHTAGCVMEGVHVETQALYAMWCCP